MSKERIKLSDMASRIYQLINYGHEVKKEKIYDDVYSWFWHNEASRHLEDIEAMSIDVGKLEQIINDKSRCTIDIETAIAMKQFLMEELNRHKQELINIESKKLSYGNGKNDVRSIPAIRVEVE